jgi:hypothetical protein
MKGGRVRELETEVAESEGENQWGPSRRGPKWHPPIGSMQFHRAQKTLDFLGPTNSHLPS